VPTVTLDTSGRFAAGPAHLSPRARRAGWTFTALVGAFLLLDIAIKLLRLPIGDESARELGYPPEIMFGIGLVHLTFLIIYLIPRTAPLGAVLLTGYLGGAVATHVRVDNPLFSHQLFPIYVAVFVWGGLYLRDARVRALVALT
jgi:hypothetical protein